MSDYVLTTEAARILHRSNAMVHYYERVGRLPAARTGGGVRLFRRADVERLAVELSPPTVTPEPAQTMA
jgi:DNA-binding transcriptional MerR regulator